MWTSWSLGVLSRVSSKNSGHMPDISWYTWSMLVGPLRMVILPKLRRRKSPKSAMSWLSSAEMDRGVLRR